MQPKKIIAIVGPTASGKTKLALQLALRMNGEIISADSRQIYRSLDKGTGKPSAIEQLQVKHHLLSFADPTQTVTAEDYRRLADQAYENIIAANKTCFLVGGTGLWIRSFLDGLSPVPPADPVLRARLQERAEQEGNASLHKQLEAADPETACRLHISDRLRIIRALEILLLTGEKPSLLRKQKSIRKPRLACWFGINRPRKNLYLTAEQRIDAWLANGWLEEVACLLKKGVPADSPAMQAIGYSHLTKHLQGEYSWDQAVSLIKRDTRRYIKRQTTWFKAEKRIAWIEEDKSDKDIHGFTEERFKSP